MSGFHLVETINGRFHFVGRVPTELVSDDVEVQTQLSHCGETIARALAAKKGARFTTSYATREEAENAKSTLVGD